MAELLMITNVRQGPSCHFTGLICHSKRVCRRLYAFGSSLFGTDLGLLHLFYKNHFFFRKVGIFSPALDEAIKMPSLLNLVSSFLALMTHQIESLL